MTETDARTTSGGPDEPRRAAIYYRSAAQADESRVEDDIAACTATAEAAGLEVAEVYVDNGVSGLSEARPAWTLLQRAVEAGVVNAIVTRDPTRIGRGSDVGDILGRLASAGVAILFVDPDARWSESSGLGEALREALDGMPEAAARRIRRLGTRPVSGPRGT